METTKTYSLAKDPRLINCKTECGNERCFAKRYGLFAEKTCPNFVEPKLITNYDRIRAMSVEEMAEYHTKMCGCPPGNDPIFCGMATIGCKGCWLDWLKQEASE